MRFTTIKAKCTEGYANRLHGRLSGQDAYKNNEVILNYEEGVLTLTVFRPAFSNTTVCMVVGMMVNETWATVEHRDDGNEDWA